MDVKTHKLAQKLWDYHHLNHKIKLADIIIVFTSLDLSVPKYAAELYKKKLAQQLLIAGDNAVHHAIKNNIQATDWGMSEAERFAQVIMHNGVPKKKIIIESRSTNSEENVKYSYKILAKNNKIPKKIILAQKPTMERRAYATFKNFWPEENYELFVTSPPFKYHEYVGKIIDADKIINIMVGDLQRIKIYPAKGFQIPQNIPDDVWQAYKKLIALGYTQHLVPED